MNLAILHSYASNIILFLHLLVLLGIYLAERLGYGRWARREEIENVGTILLR
jgi:hypothetical protein